MELDACKYAFEMLALQDDEQGALLLHHRGKCWHCKTTSKWRSFYITAAMFHIP
jgi:hypothetical protein